MGRKAAVLVTNASHGSAIAVIRALGRRGWPVVAADSTERSPGFYSRYATDHALYPSPEDDPQACIRALLRIAREKAVALVIPASDSVILPLSEQRDLFRDTCKLALPSPEALATVTDKERTLQLARRLGVPTPRAHLVHTAAEAQERARDLGWPVVLKPVASRVYRAGQMSGNFRVSYAEDRDELSLRMRELDGRCPVLLQEWRSGVGSGVELLLHEGRVLAAFQHRRLREHPVHGGASAFRESVSLDPVLYDYSVRMLREIAYTGLAMVEFRVGEDGPVLMEINGRVWGSLPLAVHSGMDFPGRLAELYLEGPPPPDAPPALDYRLGVRSHNVELELLWLAAVLRGKSEYPFLPAPPRSQALGVLASMVDPRARYDILARDDPQPGLVKLSGLFTKGTARLRRPARSSERSVVTGPRPAAGP